MFGMLDFIKKKQKKNCINWTFDGSLTQGDVVWCIRVYTISLLIKVKWLTMTHASRKECVFENYYAYFSTKTYVVGTHKNRLNDTVLLSTQNTCLN